MTHATLILILSLLCAAPPDHDHGAAPDLDYFHTQSLPLTGFDPPAISNHWLWAQAAAQRVTGILNMEDVRPGGQPQFDGTVVVRVGGRALTADPRTAEWWPNKVRRRCSIGGVEYVGTVAAAAERYALLGRLVATNRTATTKKIDVEMELIANGGHCGAVENPSSRRAAPAGKVFQYNGLTLGPDESISLRVVNLYRSEGTVLEQMLTSFDEEWKAADRYWNDLLADAFTPGPGPYLSGGAPRLATRERDAQRYYNFGVMTALMLMKRDPDKAAATNLYVTSMPDASYGTCTYIWDVGYISDLLAMMDPEALRAIVERWAAADVHGMLALLYDHGPSRFTPGRFYASNGSMFFLSAWNYLHYTGDYAWLDKRVGERTMLEHLRRAADWHKTRPAWNGLAHYGEESNLFDDHTVVGYHHFVAAPNAADVWVNRALAEIYEQRYRDKTAARALWAEADRIAEALNKHLYNDAGEHAGTWKQRHADGTESKIRHSWDFMCAGSFMVPDLTPQQKGQMRDWFMHHLVRVGSDDVWVVAQDPRDGNNGPHQMEHNGRGAYPAWPYHDGWALAAMGFEQDVIDLLRVVDGIPRWGAIGQGHHPDGRRCRSNWASAAGGTAACYLIKNVFRIEPGFGKFAPEPKLGHFDRSACLDGVCVKGELFRVTASGAERLE